MIQNALAKLRVVLADLYPEVLNSRVVVEDSGLDPSHIEFSNRSIDNWHNILKEAQKRGKVEAVIDVALHGYSDNVPLLMAVIEWQRVRLRSLQPSTTTSSPEFPIDFDWVIIPAGEFLMGSDKERHPMAFDDELPQHVVYLPEFRISRVLVTNEQYESFIRATSYKTRPKLYNS